MSQSINDFWRFLASSKLLTVPVIKQLAAEFAKEKHDASPTPTSIAQWLINRRAINKQQATELLAAFRQKNATAPPQEVSGQKAQAGAQKAEASVPPPTTNPLPIVIKRDTAASGTRQVSRPLTTADPVMRRRKSEKQRTLIVLLLAASVMLLAAFGGGLLWWMNQSGEATTVAHATSPTTSDPVPAPAQETEVGSQPADAASPSEKSPAAAPAEKAAATAQAGGLIQQLVPDDGRILWASPTSGPPVNFRCVPPAGQVFLILRPAAMLASEEGRRVFSALGPEVEAQRRALEAATGFKLEEISRLHITLHNNDSKFPRVSYVVQTVESFSKADLFARWKNPSETKQNDATYYSGPTWSYYISSAPEDERTFALGEASDIKDVAAAGGAPPAVYRELERLRRATDRERHFTVLFYPQFLFDHDGEPLFAGQRAAVRESLAWLLGDQVLAACVSAHFDSAFYLEARLRGAFDQNPRALALELQSRLQQVPGSIEDYFVSLDPPPYWKKLASRYPLMVRELQNQLRIVIEDDLATLNSVLPEPAAHNLVLGGELLVATAPGPGTSAAAAPVSSGPRALAEALQIKTSYSFDNQSLEFAMRDLADDVQGNLRGAPFEFAIKIIGDDLKLDGITRNQSIRDFKQENQTIADILTALVRKANPVTTVKDPSEKDQKLVWVIGPDPDNPSKQAVLITTRTAATAKKYELGFPFVAKK